MWRTSVARAVRRLASLAHRCIGLLTFKCAGYYATADGVCVECPDSNCITCANLTGACTYCYKGWGAVDGVCRPCGELERLCMGTVVQSGEVCLQAAAAAAS